MSIASSDISKLGIVGAGTMGTTIAVALSKLGLPIKLIDKEPNALATGLKNIEKIFSNMAKKEQDLAKLSDIKSRRALIEATNNFSDFVDLDLIIEAVNEDLLIKKDILQTLDKLCQEKTIFASNTSSFSITQLASFTNREDKVVGMHFFNPAHIMSLVEIIPGLETNCEIVHIVTRLAQAAGKSTVRVGECASFLVNRVLTRYLNEAIWILQNGLASVEEIDSAACQLLMPIGPLQLRDMNGLDVGLSVARFNFEEYGERFRPAPLLALMVDKNMLGKKTHCGFYSYSDTDRKPIGINPDLAPLIADSRAKTQPSALPAFQSTQLFLPMINEIFLLLQEKIVSPQDIDPALKAALGMKQGILEFAFSLGLNNCLAQIEALHQIYGERFRPAPLLKRYVWAKKQSIA